MGAGVGATVFGTVGSREKADVAKNAGCEHIILYKEHNFVYECLNITAGRGVDVIFDAVGRDTFLKSYESLATCGHLISFGQASGPIPAVDIASFSSKSATVSRPNFGHYTDTPEQAQVSASRVFRALRSGILNVTVSQRFPLSRAADAHRALESRATTGSLLLIPGQ